MKSKLILLVLSFILTASSIIKADDGYRLWLKYDLVTNAEYLKECRKTISGIDLPADSPTLVAARAELKTGLSGLTGINIPEINRITRNGIVVAGTPLSCPFIAAPDFEEQLKGLGCEGYLIKSVIINGGKAIVIAANKDIGVLYGVFHFLRLIQTQNSLTDLSVTETPKISLRLLNHWDNLDRTVERGYAGFSIWNWHLLPDYISPQYIDYARANASVGINGTVITNVNANALVLTSEYLHKVAAIADVMRPYGIRVYLTARFSAPVEVGGLKTSDPLDNEVIEWWKEKADELYSYIPDFGGFLVKANSEGQPGPQNYGRTHADGANMLADALAPHGGVVMWRAFVYDNKVPEDRAKQAYNEFTPLDGRFHKNVLVQVKNGPIDFQPREPFHPLFGAMPETPLMMEFQITQEYLGCSTHLVFLAPLFEECLKSDTYSKGPGSYVAKVIDGSLENNSLTGIAGVSNIGTERNWTGHLFGQANWFAFGRLAWNPYFASEDIAEEWVRMTFSGESDIVSLISKMMLSSHETAVNYMTPLGLHHIMAAGHHYGPGPWVDTGRSDWTSVYYHKADTGGIGFDRSVSGSNAVSQYSPPLNDIFGDLSECPENLLLWFHHVRWDFRMKSGRTLWDELCFKYQEGVDGATLLLKEWDKLNGRIDPAQFDHVRSLLSIQVNEARWWRDACILYFQTYSMRPIPLGLEKPQNTLEYYTKLKFRYVPGI